jgi:hypothetical protein
MSQGQIIKYLKKMNRPVDIHELIINVSANRSSITTNCRRLIKFNEIKMKPMFIGRKIKHLYYL